MIPLEDGFLDVLGKAQRGAKLSEDDLLKQAGVSRAEFAALTSGQPDDKVLQKLARVLNLRADALIALARGAWYPRIERPERQLRQFNTTYQDMTVNAYLVWDKDSGEAVVFDTGSDSTVLTEFAGNDGLKIVLILLTHTHPDHIHDLARLKEATKAPVYVSELEPTGGAEPFRAGKTFGAGCLKIETRLTSGHSKGGITYVVSGLNHPVAVVGDSLFAGSMGGGAVSYQDALRNNREKILTLPDETIVCPGHGPLTTVGLEKKHNPFFPS